MTLPEEGSLLRIFIGESDRHGGKPLYEWLVATAREQGLAGATALRGLMGYGAHSRMHTFKVERTFGVASRPWVGVSTSVAAPAACWLPVKEDRHG